MDASHSNLKATLKTTAQRRIRNQVSNILIFGTLICLAGAGLVYGAMTGVFLVGRTDLGSAHPIFKLGFVIFATLCGFGTGVTASCYVSPYILRYAFFAERIGEWKRIAIYACSEEDLPGNAPNVFVAGFRSGMGPFRPAIFASKSAFRLLSQEALEAVFAHELSHLRLGHLSKRVATGIATFVVASLFTSALLIGMQWSGYANIGGAISIFAGIIPAVLTWMTSRNLLWKQEFEADANAIREFGATPMAILEALTTLQKALPGEPHPLVKARQAVLTAQIEAITPQTATTGGIGIDRAA